MIFSIPYENDFLLIPSPVPALRAGFSRKANKPTKCRSRSVSINQKIIQKEHELFKKNYPLRFERLDMRIKNGLRKSKIIYYYLDLI